MSRRVPWFALTWGFALIAGWLGSKALALGFTPPPCPFKALTGLSCATCGATRCVLALCDGRFLQALHWHPVLVLLLVLSPAAVGWDLRRAWLAQAYPPLPEAAAWRWAAAASLLGTWAVQALRGI